MKVHKNILQSIFLDGKVALVTGSASGIGRAAAKRLAEAGARLALLDIQESKGKKVQAEIENLGTKAEFFPCDVRVSHQCSQTIQEVCREFGKIDILVNNAGSIIRKNTVDLTEEEWDFMLEVNLKSIYLLSHHILPGMIQNRGGIIINVSSGWGLKGGTNAAAYCAAKGGVINLTRAMAIDHGPDNIRVNCVCPGDTETALLHSEAAQLGMNKDQFLKEASARPLHRVGLPGDIADAILYLASDLSSWVTGSVLIVDGGGTA